MNQHPSQAGREYALPGLGSNPSSQNAGTTPGSFARTPQIAPDVRGRLTFSSPDAPGMPAPSDKTAWDFLPEGWETEDLGPNVPDDAESSNGHLKCLVFQQGDGTYRRVSFPADFDPITQLEHARLGFVTPQMERVAERESHLTPEQVRDEVAAGRMVIPANKVHLAHHLDPMCIGRASKTKVNANMGASPVSSGTLEEIEKLRWAERWVQTR